MMSEIKSFGIKLQSQPATALDRAHEEIKVRGFAIIPDVLDAGQISEAKSRLDSVCARQVEEFGRENIEKINELDTVRCPLVYDDFFLKLITLPAVISLVRKVIGEYAILNLQNGIICHPNRPHHQASWHRDLTYQEFVISKPLAISVLFALDEFTEMSGATWLVPGTHKQESIPSADYILANRVPALAKPGSVLFFDSMLLHCTGDNRGSFIRRALNNYFTIPLLSQQISLPQALQGKYSDQPELRRLLGYDSQPAASAMDWRQQRLDRINSTLKK